MLMGRKEVLSAYLAAAISIACYFRSTPPTVFFGGVSPKSPKPSTLTQEQIDAYHNDGYLLIRGFVTDKKEISSLVRAGKKSQKAFSIFDFKFKELYTKLRFQQWRVYPEFASLVFESSLPSISAQLLEEKKGIRLMKDALFAQNSQTKGCGWHVDDAYFWQADTNGVTAWLALSDDMKSLRLAPGSHRASWALECREAIAHRPSATCSMANVHPKCNSLLDEISVGFTVQAGDMLLWDRWMFHRSEVMDTDQLKARYSVRFIPQGAKVHVNATSVHASVNVGEEFRGPFYPQVWPAGIPEEVEAIHRGLESDDSSPMAIVVLLWNVGKKEVSKWIEAKMTGLL